MPQTSPTILLVEDNEDLANQLTPGLVQGGYRVLCATTLGMARMILQRQDVGLILLDVMLPDGSGLELLKSLRAAANSVPVIVLTARDTSRDKVQALDWGADDYMTKPFWIEELLARIRAVERRVTYQAATHVYVYDTLCVDIQARTLTLDGQRVHLTPTQWTLLQVLIRRAGRPVRRDHIRDALLPGEDSGTDAVHAHISRLRKKLGPHGWRLETVWGIGYTFATGDKP